jgi:hypothetical protein
VARVLRPSWASKPVLGIVDAEGTAHAEWMKSAAHWGGLEPRLRWIRPTLNLPDDLRRLEGLAALAVPIDVHGGNPDDLFTLWLIEALREVRARGIPVFVAMGTRSPNALAAGGLGVAPFREHLLEPDWWKRAAIRCGSRRWGTSGACVRAALLAAFLRIGT